MIYSPSATIFAVLSERADSTGGVDPRRALVVGDPRFRSGTSIAMAVAEPGSSVSRGITDTTLYRSALGGNPEALESLSPLPGTRLEAQTIARLSGNALLLVGDEATEERLSALARSAALDSFGTLHFATHALADDQRPWRSSLLLSHVTPPDGYEAARTGERIFDGRITAGEILREWKLRARLVTLSACQTGMGRDLGGEGIVGLAHTFLQVGTQSVLASLWAVDDRATSLLMQRFYEEWWGSTRPNKRGRGTVSKSEALQRAKQWLRSKPEYDRPFCWAAFVLIGSPS